MPRRTRPVRPVKRSLASAELSDPVVNTMDIAVKHRKKRKRNMKDSSPSVISEQRKASPTPSISRSDLECVICCSLFVGPVTLSCNHTFCYTCIVKWHDTQLSRHSIPNCPFCRGDIDSNHVHYNPQINEALWTKVLTYLRSRHCTEEEKKIFAEKKESYDKQRIAKELRIKEDRDKRLAEIRNSNERRHTQRSDRHSMPFPYGAPIAIHTHPLHNSSNSHMTGFVHSVVHHQTRNQTQNQTHNPSYFQGNTVNTRHTASPSQIHSHSNGHIIMSSNPWETHMSLNQAFLIELPSPQLPALTAPLPPPQPHPLPPTLQNDLDFPFVTATNSTPHNTRITVVRPGGPTAQDTTLPIPHTNTNTNSAHTARHSVMHSIRQMQSPANDVSVSTTNLTGLPPLPLPPISSSSSFHAVRPRSSVPTVPSVPPVTAQSLTQQVILNQIPPSNFNGYLVTPVTSVSRMNVRIQTQPVLQTHEMVMPSQQVSISQQYSTMLPLRSRSRIVLPPSLQAAPIIPQFTLET